MKIEITNLILLLAFLFLGAALSIWANPTLAQQNVTPSNCSACHGAVEPTSSLKNCQSCHSGHTGSEPQTTDPNVVHRIHPSAGAYIGSERKFCLKCHKTPDCSDCHNSHPRLSNKTECNSCHGGLPDPKGHEDVRSFLRAGKHAWMNSCLTCHAKDKDKLQFSTLTTDMKNSTELCRICHPIEYRKMLEGTHGTANKKCINCHEPHLTNIIGEVKAAQTQSNQSLWESIGKLTEGIPLLKNPLVLIILIIIIVAAGSEYILTRHEKEKVVMSDLLKITGDVGSAKAMEIELANEFFVHNLMDVIKERNVGILGMTLHREPKIKLVLFLDFSKANVSQDTLLNFINNLKGVVVSAEYSEKYEF